MTRRKRMLVLCPFPEGVAAGQRLKYEQYFDDWRTAGYDITVSPFMSLAMWRVVYEKGHVGAKVWGTIRGTVRRWLDLLRVARFDVVYIFMWVTPVGTSVMERLVRRLAKRVIFDVEDNVLVEQKIDPRDNPNPLMRFIKGRGKTRALIHTADHVITSSPFLNDFCLAINAKRACTYISSSVDTDRFQPATPYTNDRKVVVGWTGTYSSKMYLDQLRDVFVRLAKQAPYTLKVIGNFDYDLPGVDLEVVRWTAAREVPDLQTFDIGVYPLPIDDWVLGKSGLKAIQYMAFALPCVATEVGTTPMLIRDGENGRLVRTADEWVEALAELIADPDLRRRLGTAARADAVAKYSLHAIADQYRAVLAAVE